MSEIKIDLPDNFLSQGVVEALFSREAKIKDLQLEREQLRADLTTLQVMARSHFGSLVEWSNFTKEWQEYRKTQPKIYM
jgi:hypothetical protein